MAELQSKPSFSDRNVTMDGYGDWLSDVKARVRATQFRAARAANAEVLRLYWSIGKDILDRQERDGWGAGIVRRLSSDLRREFPDQHGWSETNLKYMRMFAQAWPTATAIGQHGVDQLPWGHLTVLLTQLSSREERDWYAERAAEEGWKRSVLQHFIKTDLRSQLGNAPTDFSTALAAPDSELAQQLVKDPYVFEHLALVERVVERDVEQALMDRLQDTLMEFGHGMAFVARQKRFEITDTKGKTDELVPDLILFNIPQLRFVVVELKVGEFQPSDLGQLAAYVGLVDDKLRNLESHAPTIGILLCTGRNDTVVRYALGNMSAALGVADYAGLPQDVKQAVPPVGHLEAAIKAEIQSGQVELNC